jgi:sulfur carrier protein ThiS
MMIMVGSSSDVWILLALWLQPLLITLSHNAITIPHTLQSTLAHALEFSVYTRHLLAAELNTETVPSNHHEVFLSLPLQSLRNADLILRF